MKMQDIGFYTLSDERCENLSSTSQMVRGGMIVTDRCNFKCPYCQGLREEFQGDMPIATAISVLDQWCEQGLENVRFSGGEPLLYPYIEALVMYAKDRGVKMIGLSSNGSFPFEKYDRLRMLGVNDFGFSLDACAADECDKMAGINSVEAGIRTISQVVTNIRKLAATTYVTAGIVLTDENVDLLPKLVKYAHDLGVADIRLTLASQDGAGIPPGLDSIPQYILDEHPILAYRVANAKNGRPVRSLREGDSPRCYVPVDDNVVAGNHHFPCMIYMREKGDPIGEIGPNMRTERVMWTVTHDVTKDPICRANCLDFCADHNNKCALFRREYEQRQTEGIGS
jgi:molybdenum cofactor biosynthesis enzyme MoaA